MERFFATAPKGLVEVLRDEVTACGGKIVAQNLGGVTFEGTLENAYRVCLWSRVANRVLKQLSTFSCEDDKKLYGKIRSIRWDTHLDPMGTFAVDFFSTHSNMTHSHYGALRVKDAIVDQMRDKDGNRPSIDTKRPDVLVNVYLNNNEAIVGLDLSGDSLHRRGYRIETAPAPLKENLAAGILILAGWPEASREGKPFLDPMCGSGTLVIEAAMIACDRAPGLNRRYWGFNKWKQHQPEIWNVLIKEAEARFEAGKAGARSKILGLDSQGRTLTSARDHSVRAGIEKFVEFEKMDFRDFTLPAELGDAGVMIANPPYGERLGDTEQLMELYTEMGNVMKRQLKSWTAWILTAKGELTKKIGLRASKRLILFNGPIECRLLKFELF